MYLLDYIIQHNYTFLFNNFNIILLSSIFLRDHLLSNMEKVVKKGSGKKDKKILYKIKSTLGL